MTASTNQRCHFGLRLGGLRLRLGGPRRCLGGPQPDAAGLGSRLRGGLAKAALGVLVGLSCACGPFGYLKKVSVDASRAVAQAEKAGAAQYAPYEYWGAVTYLEQAKVLMAYSEYDRAFDYGDRAKQLADEAKKKAAMREAGKMRESTDDARSPGAVAPAQTPAATAPSRGAEVEVGGSVGGGR